MVKSVTDSLHPKSVAVILPVLNEINGLETCLRELQQHSFNEIIVVDGGSQDGTWEMLQATVAAHESQGMGRTRFEILQTSLSRGRQMQAGANRASADILLFLHADCVLPAKAMEHIREVTAGGYLWGRFDVRLSGNSPWFRVIEYMMNLRSALTGNITGDQALFVRRDVYRMLGGYAPIALMEDVEFASRLKWVGRPAHVRERVLVSSRRWERQGIIRSIVLMWSLRLLYWLGVSPARLARWYQSA